MSMEILLILVVALIVFGPQKLPMLATHLGLLLRQIQRFKEQASMFWQQHVQEQQLQDNQRKAKEAEEKYKAAEKGA